MLLLTLFFNIGSFGFIILGGRKRMLVLSNKFSIVGYFIERLVSIYVFFFIGFLGGLSNLLTLLFKLCKIGVIC